MKKSFRPTKAASKRRRDLLNSEISCIRNLLPFTEIQRQRLSQIQVMSLCNAYVALNNFMADFCLKEDSSEQAVNSIDMAQIYPGFLLILSSSGQVLYVSETVVDYLGYSSMELLTQGDSVFDFVEADDHSSLRNILTTMSSPDAFSTPRTVSCRMFLAPNFRNLYNHHHSQAMTLNGHVVRRPTKGSRGAAVPEALFVAFVLPQSKPFFDSIDFPSFQSFHGLDMKFTEIDYNGCIWLGYDSDEVKSKSWYELVYPDDVSRAKEVHLNVLQSQRRDDRPSSFCVRVQTRYGHFVWLRVTMRLRGGAGDLEIACSNCVVTDEVAREILRGGELNRAGVTCGAIQGGRTGFCGVPSGDNGSGSSKKQRFSSPEDGGAVTLESSSDGFSRTQRTMTKSSLRSPYPLLKAMLNQPTVRALRSPAMQTCSFDICPPLSNLVVSGIDALLTPQNSPDDRALQEFTQMESLSPTRMYASEGVPNGWEFKQVSHSGWEQSRSAYGFCETPPMDQVDHVAELDSALTETTPFGFEHDVETLSLDVIVDALKAMQNDPELSKEVDRLDLGVFSKSFPELENMNLPASLKLPSSVSLANPLSVLLPFFNSTMSRLSTDQVETLNRRLFELKKIHETLVVETIVETLHCESAKTSSSWSELQDFGLRKGVVNL